MGFQCVYTTFHDLSRGVSGFGELQINYKKDGKLIKRLQLQNEK